MTIQELKDQAEQLRTKARGLKTKKAKSKAYDSAGELESQAWFKLCDERAKYGEFSFKAVISHSRSGDEHFLAETPYGSMWLSPTSDILSKSWYAHTCCIEYTKGQTIVVNAKIEVNNDRLSLEVIPGEISGGSVNETQYSELCKRDNLAFFKYPTGMTGLFK